MGALTLLSLIVGGFVGGLVILAIFVAGWEMLRQREALELLRRDRAVFAATSPLPLTAAARAGAEASPALASELAAASEAPGPRQATRREPNWIETRPMVLRYAPAVDDETVTHQREPDLRLD